MEELEKIELFRELKASAADWYYSTKNGQKSLQKFQRFVTASNLVDDLGLYEEYLAWLEMDSGKSHDT